MQLSRKEPIHWCTGRGGKTNQMPLKILMIDPDGNVVWMSLGNGKAQTNMMGNVYAQWISAAKARRDFIPYFRCEAGCSDVPTAEKVKEREVVKASLCEGCAGREVLIETRQEAKNFKNADYAKLFETRLDKLAEVLERKMAGESRPVVSPSDLADVMTASPSGKKKGTRG